MLRNRQLFGHKFRRQHPLKEGFILDFYCPEKRLAVEVDGGYHNSEEQQILDIARTEALNEKGILVIRFKNRDVLEHPVLVLQEIARYLG